MDAYCFSGSIRGAILRARPPPRPSAPAAAKIDKSSQVGKREGAKKEY
jgi:hypothetical protein